MAFSYASVLRDLDAGECLNLGMSQGLEEVFEPAVGCAHEFLKTLLKGPKKAHKGGFQRLVLEDITPPS